MVRVLVCQNFGSLNLGCLESSIFSCTCHLIVVILLLTTTNALTRAFVDAGNELDIDLGSTTNVRFSALSKLNSCLAVLNDNIAANIRFALLTDAHNAVVSAGFDLIAPANGRRTSRFVVADDFDAVFMGFLDYVVHD